jgi:hypothetical protein
LGPAWKVLSTRGSRNRIARIFLARADLGFGLRHDETERRSMMPKRPMPPTKPTMRPPPILYSDWSNHVDESGVFSGDILNVYVTVREGAELAKWSETHVRKLIKARFLLQEYRGIIRMRDLIQCQMDYIVYGKGREVNDKKFGDYDDGFDE